MRDGVCIVVDFGGKRRDKVVTFESRNFKLFHCDVRFRGMMHTGRALEHEKSGSRDRGGRARECQFLCRVNYSQKSGHKGSRMLFTRMIAMQKVRLTC